MNGKQLSERIGNLDDRLVQQAGEVPNYARRHRRRIGRRLVSLAAVLALMVCSGAVGALAFREETVVEVPAEQETVELAEIGVTLVLPESWKGKYEVIEDTFTPYGSTLWEFCDKAVYDARVPLDGSGELFYRGSLFTVFQYADYSMSAEEFAQSGLAGIGRYLFATQDATYAVLYATDLQCDPENAEQSAEWNAMEQTVKDIRFLIAPLGEQG